MDAINLRSFVPDDADWVTQQHQHLYRAAEGFDVSFGPLVADILATFVRDHDPDRQAGWIAQSGEARLGSIFVVGKSETCAKLRLFLVVPAARGSGLADRMLSTALGFARSSGYSRMELWTHESHVAAGRLYARHGFKLTDAHPVHSFGVDLVEQTWQIAL